MIELTEEPIDGELGRRFVATLLAELNERYVAELAGLTEAERALGDTGYLEEVRPDEVLRPNGAFVVAWRDGEPVACGALRPLGVKGVAEIKRMYTIPAARGQGISKVVLRALEALAVELGYRRIQLETGTGQPEAVALYESFGWQRIERYEGSYMDEGWSIFFGKDLAVP